MTTPENAETIKNAKIDLRICSPLKITITGSQSEELFGTIDEVFNSVSFPELIVTVFVNSDVSYRTLFKHFPENSFQLLIDYSKPKVFDFSIQPSETTPNDSQFYVQGSDNTWVNGVFYEIDSYIKTKASKFSYIHKGNMYELLFWFFGIPFGFWVCYKIIHLNLPFFASHHFLENFFLTYSFLLSLFIIRILFHYFRWVYPMVEYRSKKERSLLHQAALISICLGLIGKFLYDVIKYLFSG